MGINCVQKILSTKRCTSRENPISLLFNVFVNEISEILNKSGNGRKIGATIINHMLYDYDYDYDYDYEMLLLRHKEIQYNMS